MDCERIADQFGAFYEGDSDAQTEKMVKEHLKSCEACREDFKWYGVTIQAMANLEQVAPPNDFLQQLNARIDKTSSPFQSIISQIKNLLNSLPTVPVPVGAVSLAFVTVIAFFVYYAPSEIIQTGKSDMTAKREASTPPIEVASRTVQPHMVASAPFASQPAPYSRALVPYDGAGRPSSATVSWRFPTVADEIGGDNLTVESPRFDIALKNLKDILPDIQGQLIDEKIRWAHGEALVGVIIPCSKYGDLASALVNHGAVEVGARSLESESPAPTRVDNSNVRLYIRFTQAPQ